ncbi:unnamed protein product [Sphagnum troendelagicum]|uniref:R3H domain-containing protein n=1 Tax=Sphagnum troendelagicum TaxID=128251 RepID=A0ABP0TL47_9BRYO
MDNFSISLHSKVAITNFVDSFLREALQNPRDRLTILRLEQEVERFMHNPGQQMLEFQPMPSSYLRLAAHRVAQHYSLQSMVVDSGSTEGTRIVARKTSGSRYPAVRLVDIPVTMNQEDKTDVPSVMPVKIAIKQRPQKGSHAYGGGLGGNDSKINTSKSVEERKEEYNKARARIFCSKLGGKGDDDESEPESEASVDCFRSDAGRLEKAKDEDAVSASLMNQHSESPPMAIRTVITSAEKEKEHVRGKPSTSNGMGNGMSNGGSRVAIFRDREKDRRDPDYDRNTSRYGQRFDPGFGVSLGPYGVQALYAPLVNYNTEFPQLGVASRPQAHMEPPRPPPIPQQHMQASWTPPVNTMSYRPPDPSLMRPFSPAHTAPVAMYMHPPQYAYAGHAMTYMHPPDSYQQSLSQPHPQQQPDTSFNQTWRH